MITRLRSFRDVVKFVVGSEFVFAVSLAITLASLLPLIPGWPRLLTAIIGVAALTGSVWAAAMDSRRIWGRWRSFRFNRTDIFFGSGIPEMPGLPDLVVTEAGTIATDWGLVDALVDADPVATYRAEATPLPGELKEMAPYILRQTTGGSIPYNGSLVGLETDVSVEGLAASQDLHFRRTSFFSLLCSNELGRGELIRDGVSWPFKERYLLDAEGRFLALAQSDLANVVGISTLALTTDDQLLVPTQSDLASASRNRLAPSGSGSLEPEDAKHEGSGNRLSEVICGGAERELREECSLPAGTIAASRLLGYGRWVGRGAKPEFVCVTALTVDASQALAARKVHRDEHLWTKREVQAVPLELGAGANPATLLESVEARGAVSLPLAFALECLARRVRSDLDLLDDLRS